MRFCFSCRKVTSGDPAYCNFCGRSYDVKLCSRGHSNPRSAEVCSECGSRDLSIPQARGGSLLKAVILVAIYLPSTILLVASVGYLVFFAKNIFTNLDGLVPLMLIGLALGLFWLVWMAIVSSLRSLLKGGNTKRKR